MGPTGVAAFSKLEARYRFLSDRRVWIEFVALGQMPRPPTKAGQNRLFLDGVRVSRRRANGRVGSARRRSPQWGPPTSKGGDLSPEPVHRKALF